MKISILGRGNAGCISALHLNKYNVDKKFELELIYDPCIKPVPTGQGTVIGFPQVLWENFGTSYTNSFPYTLKTGIMYEDWGEVNKTHFHGFPFGLHAIHFQPIDFQNYVCDNLKINFSEKKENIIDYDEVDADYIIDCRGKPKDMDFPFGNYDTLVNPINCALLGSLPKKDNDVHWTRTIATPDGWCFYIPLPDTTSVGYLYNRNITSEEQARSNFEELLGVKDAKVFPFEQYVAREPIIEDHDSRVLLNGNRLFFLEPMEATAMSSYQEISEYYVDYIMNEKHHIDVSNNIRNYVKKIQDFILLHYRDGSKYNTPFWSYAKQLYKDNQSEELNNIIRNIEKESSTKEGRDIIHRENFQYGQWKLWSIANWHYGRTKEGVWPNCL